MAITIYKYAYHVDWDAEGVGVTKIMGGGSYVDLTNYYTIPELQTSGDSEVHFDNITEAYHNNLLDIQGGISTSSGDSSGIDAEYYHLDYYSWLNNIVGDGTGVSNQVAVFDTSNLIVGDSDFTWDNTSSAWSRLKVIGDIQTDDDESNTKLGIGSLLALTDGTANVAIGTDALIANTSGAGHVAVGYQALYSCTTATGNIAIGYQSLYTTSETSEYNIAIGVTSLYSCTEGQYNVAVGFTALYNLTTGYGNTAVGSVVLYNTTEGSWNTAFGYDALDSNTTGSWNTAVGVNALFAVTTGVHNIGVGVSAGYYSVDSYGYFRTGSYNIFIGYLAKAEGTDDVNEIVIGSEAIGQGSNTAILGGIDNAATYLTGEIYCVVYDSDNVLSGGLPAKTSETDVVYYDPSTGKLSYGTAPEGDSSGAGGGVDVYGTPEEHDIVVWYDADTITNLENFKTTQWVGGYNVLTAPFGAIIGGEYAWKSAPYTYNDRFYIGAMDGDETYPNGTHIEIVSGHYYSGGEGLGGRIKIQVADSVSATKAHRLELFGGGNEGVGSSNDEGGSGGDIYIESGYSYSDDPDAVAGDVYISAGYRYSYDGNDFFSKGFIYFGDGYEGCLPEVDSSDTIYVVTYNPDTGKLGYTALI